jgi:asparagine synthase (glutamine-hydrolysing)
MCGLAGFWSRPSPVDVHRPLLEKMTRVIAHRGPDSVGAWFDEPAGLALGHRRLAIMDLSPAGAQPMLSSSGRWVIAFNGEIYNYVELRTELERLNKAPVWRGASDTETLLPMQYKLRPTDGHRVTKWALREVLYRHVPSSLIDRPKQGFGVPLRSSR